jgi:hypothetical protein
MRFKFVNGDVNHVDHGGSFYAPVQVEYDGVMRDGALILRVYGSEHIPDEMRTDFLYRKRKQEKANTGRYRTSENATVHLLDLAYVCIGDMTDEYILQIVQGHEEDLLSIAESKHRGQVPLHYCVAEILSSYGAQASLFDVLDTNYAVAWRKCVLAAESFVRPWRAQQELEHPGNAMGSSRHEMMSGHVFGKALPDVAPYRPPEEVIDSLLRSLKASHGS